MRLPDLDVLIAAVAAEAEGIDSLAQLTAAARTRDELDRLGEVVLDHFIQRAREAGCSWRQIGEALGVSKQAAQQRHTGTESVVRRLLARLPGGGRGERDPLVGRLTQRAQSSVALAHEEAGLLDHNYVGTEHLLLGVLRVEDGTAAKALRTMGVSVERVRGEVTDIIGRGQASHVGQVPFTPRATKVLELSVRETERFGQGYIGTEHILLAIISEGEGLACQVLHRLGAEPARVRETVMALLNPAA